MPALLYGIGAFALFAGLLMIGFGIPINEFSFGNTLIMAGTTASVGGLIIIGLGVVAGQLRRVAETMAMLPSRSAPVPGAVLEDDADARRPVPAQGRAPFPARPAPVAFDPVPGPAANPFDANFEDAPRLRNPDIPEALEEEEISLSPPRPAGPAVKPPANDLPAFARPTPVPSPAMAANTAEKREPMAGWRSPVSVPPPPPARPSANFDAMWPAEAKPKGPAARDPHPDAKVEPISRDAKRGEPDTQKSHSVAVLKSGVVDGMAYTLYVDGSIEAELPQGTVRFASIHELRDHLAKNS
jgi:hypothetical protein